MVFREGRSCTDNVFCLKQICKKAAGRGVVVILTFDLCSVAYQSSGQSCAKLVLVLLILLRYVTLMRNVLLMLKLVIRNRKAFQ